MTRSANYDKYCMAGLPPAGSIAFGASSCHICAATRRTARTFAWQLSALKKGETAEAEALDDESNKLVAEVLFILSPSGRVGCNA